MKKRNIYIIISVIGLIIIGGFIWYINDLHKGTARCIAAAQLMSKYGLCDENGIPCDSGEMGCLDLMYNPDVDIKEELDRRLKEGYYDKPKIKSAFFKKDNLIFRIYIPVCYRDENHRIVLDNAILHNEGRLFKSINIYAVKGQHEDTAILEFRDITTFEDCSLSFTINGEPVSITVLEDEEY